MIRLLGRQTSGNVQKMIFCLEELVLPYGREDYGRQFGNTLTEAYRKLNPNAKVPTLIDGDLVIWESHTILRYLAAVHGPALTGATPAERTHGRALDGLAARRFQHAVCRCVQGCQKDAAERAARFRRAKCRPCRPAQNTRRPYRGTRMVRARSLHHRRHGARPIVKRCLEFPIERPACPELKRWQTTIDARPAFAVATGAKPSVLTSAA